MYIRRVSLRIKTEAINSLTNIYTRNVLPALRESKGSVFACLMQDVRDSTSCFTLTMWHSKADADDYEYSGLYERLLTSLRHLFSETSDWRLINDALHPEYTPSPDRPAVVGFTDLTSYSTGSRSVPTFVHILSLTSHTDAAGAVQTIYEKGIRPAYEHANGLQTSILVNRSDEPASIHVISLWSASADPTRILPSSKVDEIVERSGALLALDPDAGGRYPGSRLSRCIAAEWFTMNGENKKTRPGGTGLE